MKRTFPWKRSSLWQPPWNELWNWQGTKNWSCLLAAWHLPEQSAWFGKSGSRKYKSVIWGRWTYPKRMVALSYPQPRGRTVEVLQAWQKRASKINNLATLPGTARQGKCAPAGSAGEVPQE